MASANDVVIYDPRMVRSPIGLIAATTGVSYWTLYSIIVRGHRPTPKTLTKMAKKMKLSVNAVLEFIAAQREAMAEARAA